MAVSVPPPLFHLTNVIQFRDDAKTMPTMATSTSTTRTTPTSLKSTKNKRKSMEPKKLTSPKNENSYPVKRLKIELDGSDGEPTHSPGSSASSSDSQISDRVTLSPKCQMMAPKKRFKQEAMKYLEEASKEKFSASSSSPTIANPFRPWDKEVASPTLKATLPTTTSTMQSPFLYSPLQTFFPPGFFPPILTPPIPPTSPAVIKTEPKSPELLIPKSEIKYTSPNRDSAPNFDAETRQVLSRLYPFLLHRDGASSFPPEEPEQDEPLALVKRNRSDDDEDVFSKDESESGKDPFSSSAAVGLLQGGKSKQRNYKNMTRERRIEANARERQRVHTITAAFDRLQGVIPTSDDNSGSKLSKLSVIKIATSYIMVLSRMAGLDYSADQDAPTVEDCIKHCAELVKAESKTRKKSSESSD